MKNRTNTWLNAGAALLVLFTAMFDPRVSAGMAFVVLIGLTMYYWTRRA
ncbi:MAG: hypothetical protein HY868_12050 [Chloroflexi bacterium]|nr:hypothetical protein [Chloroflexota bacterium]